MGAGVLVLGTVVYMVDFCTGALIGVLIFQNPDAVLHLSGAVESLSAGMLDGLAFYIFDRAASKTEEEHVEIETRSFWFLDKA